MDLLGMDVTWTAEFAEAKWIRELTGEQKTQATKDTLQPPIDTATWKDKLYGVPRTTNVQLMWYRKSLVPTPPKTFDEMISMAQKLKAEGKPYEIGFTAAQYEGYVVNVNNMVTAYGGTLVNEDSTAPTIDDKIVQALTMLQQALHLRGHQRVAVQRAGARGVRRPGGRTVGVLAQLAVRAQRDARIQAGARRRPRLRAVSRRWTAGPPKVTLGGMNYAISTYSKYPDESFEAAMCMRNEKNALSRRHRRGRRAGARHGLRDRRSSRRRTR